MIPNIIHKDRHILIIDKPAGMPSVYVPGGNTNSLDKWILENFPKQENISRDAGLINRLDNDTSGILVAARNEKTYEKMNEIWRSRETQKEYICLVIGQTPASGKICNLIAHHPDKSSKMLVVTDDKEAKQLKARFAETDYDLIEGFFDYTLLRVRIKTGVRHQIRCHLASIGYPVAGDKIYRKAKHKDRDWLGLRRHFLHASRVHFTHPSSEKPVEFSSPMPADLEKALGQLR